MVETLPREIGFVLCGHCQNLLDDPRIIEEKYMKIFDARGYLTLLALSC